MCFIKKIILSLIMSLILKDQFSFSYLGIIRRNHKNYIFLVPRLFKKIWITNPLNLFSILNFLNSKSDETIIYHVDIGHTAGLSKS